MRPSGALMIEHRLLERMIELVRKEARRISEEKQLQPLIIGTFVDFIQTYADKLHHGKEEGILFRDLGGKTMSPEDAGLMQELIDEHNFGRRTTSELAEANRGFIEGRPEFLGTVLEKLNILAKHYPIHIAKEDRQFFPAAMRYFTDDEQQNMLAEFWEYDRKLIHEKYRTVVERLEGR